MSVFDLNEYEVKIDKIISKSFSASYMSNAKWRKLFTAIDKESLSIDSFMIKRVNRDAPYRTYLPDKDDIEELWVSEGKNDCNYFYKEIEWIEFQSEVLPLTEIISSLGSFEIDNSDNKLKIYGHKT